MVALEFLKKERGGSLLDGRLDVEDAILREDEVHDEANLVGTQLLEPHFAVDLEDVVSKEAAVEAEQVRRKYEDAVLLEGLGEV